jgi:hypothetical protein
MAGSDRAVPTSGDGETTDWMAISRRAAFGVHRLIGWIYWDPRAVAAYEAAGIPGAGAGYYLVSRGAPLGAAGNQAVTAAFYSITAEGIALLFDLARQHTTMEAVTDLRNEAVGAGLREYVPDICDGLAALGGPLWATADALSPSGRVLFAAHREWPRPDDPLVSAWLAVNCIREWRGDTHFAIQTAEGLSGTAAGILDGAWRGYEDEWLPRSRGAVDDDLNAAMAELEERGLVTDGRVNEAGIAHRQVLEDRLDALTATPWQILGQERTAELQALMDEAGPTLIGRVDETAGPNWMPAGRVHARSNL